MKHVKRSDLYGKRRGERLRRAVGLCCAVLVLATAASCRRDDIYVEFKPPASQQRPERIISLSPSATEILHGVGAFGRVIAVSDYCSYPPQVKDLPRIGGWQNTNLERVVSFRPDLVVLVEVQAPFIKDRLDALKINTLIVPSRTLEDAYTAIELVGRATGNEEEAQKLLTETRSTVEAVRARARDIPSRRVLCIVDRLPGTLRDLYVATEGSFIAELIKIAGGQPIAPPVTGGFGRITKEAIVALDPEVIIDMVQGAREGSQLAEDLQSVWRELPQVRAVSDGRVYPLREESVLHPSQFVGDTARRFAEIIHPEVFRAAGKGSEGK